MGICLDKHRTVTFAKEDIKRYLKSFKYRLRLCNAEVKEHLISSYGRSLLVYFGTPLLGAKMINETTINKMEASLYREVHSLPNSIGNKAILSLAQR